MINDNSTVFSGDKLQNQFTAYVERALRNNRISYYRKYKAILKNELCFSSEDQLSHISGSSACIFSPEIDSMELSPDSVQNGGLADELRNLSEKDMSIIRMRIGFGFTYKSIAATLGMTEEAVRVRYFRAIRKIQNNLEGGTK